jgi:kynurenine 3-monooxygenase
MLSQSEDFFKNPTSTLVTVSSWTYGDKVALIGDACHAIVLFYGQGMNVVLRIFRFCAMK